MEDKETETQIDSIGILHSNSNALHGWEPSSGHVSKITVSQCQKTILFQISFKQNKTDNLDFPLECHLSPFLHKLENHHLSITLENLKLYEIIDYIKMISTFI